MVKFQVGILRVVLCLALFISWPGAALAQQAEARKGPDEAILIVAFGSSAPRARDVYGNVQKRVEAAFPGKETRWAWTAQSLLKSGPEAPRLSVQEALAGLAAEGARKVRVLSLHVIPGAEYSNLERTARALEGLPKGLKEIRLAPPLLHDAKSLGETARLLLAGAPGGRKADEALVFVGHGTRHAAGAYYPALQYYLWRLDKNAFVGVIEGDPDMRAVLGAVKAASIRKAWLAPLMTVAGEHAAHDLFGRQEDSWASVFAANGIEVEIVDKGLAEYPALVDQWVENLKKAAK